MHGLSECFVSMLEYLKALYKYHLPSFLVAGPICLEELGVMCRFHLTYGLVMCRLRIFVMRTDVDPIPQPPPQPFYSPFSGTTLVSWCQKRTSGLYGARED